ncbi:MAG: nucleotidyltransferase family protein [Candidatus Manganitrophus sp.]|nr:MAG: nucleotidyltransferase family protein [Candidatus Manganitrophus sp.]
MSNRAAHYRRINAAQNLSTVVLTSFLGFVTFSGSDKVQMYINWFIKADKAQVEFAFNLLVFFLFVLGTLHLVFNFAKKQEAAERAIVDLTDVVNYADDLLAQEERGQVVLGQTHLDAVKLRYESIKRSIPANSDSDFVKAKSDILEKERRSSRVQVTPQSLLDERQRQQVLRALVLRAPQIVDILHALKAVDSRLYLGGGLVRNLVWDYMHNFRSSTPIDDVDVIYFDKLSTTKEHDLQFEAKLKDRVPNLAWSVKNQARMHTGNGDPPYSSVEDAISKWPEDCYGFGGQVRRIRRA